ncbi:patatin-like phospholipase family protein [Sphingomonas limnosediminicola]|uniref:Patatin-like phospholipase family protein n=2 Tax=Sphingomonas limnosediminicola TaxID=940133 RepID=A0ABP7LV72_9SPHN
MPQARPTVDNVRYLVARDSAEFQAEGMRSLAKEKAWLASQGVTGPLPPTYILAISGGGDNGAFGAGLLNGWTASGTRPEFKMVTGVSTGALIAPFAFLGSRYDGAIEKFYTTISAKDIFKSRGMLKGVMSDAMADSKPLANLIAQNTSEQMLDEIAAEYAKGRILLVGTTNMDSLEPVIWNMTAIAASQNPNRLALFRSVLLASASIPGAFPPVMIDVTSDGVRHQEMHSDGGTVAQVFVYPPSIDAKIFQQTQRRRVLYVIRNARFDSPWESVPRKTMSIATRAIGSLTTTQGIGDLYRIYSTTQRDGVEFNLAYIPSTFTQHGKEEFNTAYMRELYAAGRQMAASGLKWEKYPPGYERPIGADLQK